MVKSYLLSRSSIWSEAKTLTISLLDINEYEGVIKYLDNWRIVPVRFKKGRQLSASQFERWVINKVLRTRYTTTILEDTHIIVDINDLSKESLSALLYLSLQSKDSSKTWWEPLQRLILTKTKIPPRTPKIKDNPIDIELNFVGIPGH